ncbi:M56 family metallopeptidase, partial [Streptomyces beihaiensis]
MAISVYVPFAVSALLGLFAPRLARPLPPRPAAWALACGALVTACASTVALALLAFSGIGQIPLVAEEGSWSVPALRAEDPVRTTVAVLCALALAAAAVSLARSSWRRGRSLLDTHRECRRLPGDGELAVLDDDRPQAFALPGAPGRIVVSRGMLRSLAPAERSALLAHERAHLRGRHHLFLTAWHLASSVNPMLRPLATAGAFALERWADEEAAAAVGDRAVTARAVARAALAT